MSTDPRLLAQVESAIRSLPELEVQSTRHAVLVDDQRVDLEIVATVKGRPARILVAAKASGYPRDLREAAWQLAGLRRVARPEPVLLLVAAPAISPGGRETLRRHGIGYWDTSGSLYLELPGALYFVDRPAPRAGDRRLRTVYRGARAQVLHALLVEPARAWHVRDLARHARVSPYTVHQVFGFLEAQLWVQKRGRGPQALRVLREPGALLDGWAEAHSLTQYEFHRFHRWTQSPAALRAAVGRALDRLGIEYALTLTSGAELVAPFATDAGDLSLLVPAGTDLDRLTEAAQLRPVETGENVVVLVSRDRSPLLFRQRVDDLWVASDVQLYLDLWAWPRRGREQARHLRVERLSY